MDISKFSQAIRNIPDFPKPGVMYKDITPFLADSELFSSYIDIVAERYQNNIPDYIVAIESRGFIFGSALAYKLGCGIVPVRKKGKLPYKTLEASYDLEYGSACVEIHEDALKPGDKVVLIDDLLATGGTVCAAIELLKKLDGEIISIEFLIELAFLKGRSQIADYQTNALIVVD